MAEGGAQEDKKEPIAPAKQPNNLREIRKARNLSTTQLGDYIGVTKGEVEHWEAGRRDMNAIQLVKAAELLGCTPNDILGYSKEGDLPGILRVVKPEAEEIIDLYLDNDLVVQADVKNILLRHAKHPQKFEKRHKD